MLSFLSRLLTCNALCTAFKDGRVLDSDFISFFALVFFLFFLILYIFISMKQIRNIPCLFEYNIYCINFYHNDVKHTLV